MSSEDSWKHNPLSALPVAGVAVQVHDCHDDYDHLRLSLGMELNRLHPSDARALLNTASAP